jgi:hypothetical protein
VEYYIIEQSVGCVGRIATFHRSEHQVPRREINDAQDIVIPMLILFDRIIISSVRCTGFYAQFGSEVLVSMFLAGFEEIAQGALRYHAKACVIHMLEVELMFQTVVDFSTGHVAHLVVLPFDKWHLQSSGYDGAVGSAHLGFVHQEAILY